MASTIVADRSEAVRRPTTPGTPGARRNRRAGRVPAPRWFLLPALLAYSFVIVVPDLQTLVYVFTDWNGISTSFEWVGFDNFVDAFQTRHARRGLTNTLFLTLVITVVQLCAGLALALALNSNLRTRNVLRAVFFAPVVLTSVAVGFIWKFLYSPTGSINQLLELLGLGGLAHDWLGDPSVNLWAIAFICIWQSTGYAMVIFLAGLQGIDHDLIEAAHLDGAGAWARFWYVIRPLLAPAMLINAVLAVTGGLKIFDQIFITTQGGPAYTTATLATLTYTDGFATGAYSFGVTLSVILTVIVSVVAILQFRLMSKGNDQ